LKAEFHRDIYVHSSIVYNRQKVEATHVCMDGWIMNVYTFHRESVSLKTKGNFDTSHNLDAM
jgi:hypothetical protein